MEALILAATLRREANQAEEMKKVSHPNIPSKHIDDVSDDIKTPFIQIIMLSNWYFRLMNLLTLETAKFQHG